MQPLDRFVNWLAEARLAFTADGVWWTVAAGLSGYPVQRPVEAWLA